MQRSSGTSMIVTAVLAAAVLVTIAFTGTASSLRSGGPVAVVDLARVLDGLDERADAEARLRAKGEEIRTEAEQRDVEVRDLQKRLEESTDPDEQRSLAEEIDERIIHFRAWQEFINREMDVERAVLLQNLYRDIRTSIAEMADVDGLDIILTYQSAGEIQLDPNPELPPLEAQVRQQIASRRVAFAASRVDRTEDVIIRMNNAYELKTGSR